MKAKKILLIAFVCFLFFWMFQDPQGLATTAESLITGAWDLVVGLFEALLAFVRALG